MMELREIVAREIAKGRGGSGELWPRYADDADRILAIPEIAEAMRLMRPVEQRG